MERNFTTGTILSVLSALSFSTLSIFAKIGYLKGYNTETLLFFRFLYATIIFLIFLLFKDKNLLKIKNGKEILFTFVVGFILYGLQATFFFVSVKHVGAAMTSFVLYMYPFVVTILSIIIFKMRLHPVFIITLIVTFAGIFCIFYDALNFHVPINGLIFSVLAMLTYSTYLIVVQTVLKKMNKYTFIFYTLIFCLLFFTIFGSSKVDFSRGRDFIYFTGLGIIPTSLGIIFLYTAIDRINSSIVSIFSTIELFSTLLLSKILFNEYIGIFKIVGGLFLISGIIIPNIYRLLNERKKQRISC